MWYSGTDPRGYYCAGCGRKAMRPLNAVHMPAPTLTQPTRT